MVRIEWYLVVGLFFCSLVTVGSTSQRNAMRPWNPPWTIRAGSSIILGNGYTSPSECCRAFVKLTDKGSIPA